MRIAIPPLILLPVIALLAFASLASAPACATLKGADVASCAPSSSLIDSAETALRTGDYVGELGKLVVQTSSCAVNKAVADVVDKYGAGVKAASADPGAATIVERGRTWLATHADHASGVRRDADWRMAIHLRTWRLLNGVPSPFVPARANC